MVRSAVALAVLAVAFGVAGVSARGPGLHPEPRPFDTLVTRFAPADTLGAITIASGDLWADDNDRGDVLRLDGRSGRVRARIHLPGRLALADDGHGLWALRWGGKFWRTPNGPLYRIDPVANRVVARIPLPRDATAFGVLAGGGVWVWGPTEVVRLTASRFRRAFRLDGDHGELTGAVLDGPDILAVTADGHLVRFDPSTGAHLGARVPELTAVELLGLEGRRLLATAAGTLLAVDAGSGRLLWRRPLGFHVETVVDDGGRLLAQGSALGDAGDRLWAIDPANGRVLESAVLPSFGTAGFAIDRRALWITTGDGQVLAIPRAVAG